MTPQWNADIITPEEKGSGTKVIGDNQQVQTTLESGENITIEDGKISATGDLENVQADWTQSDSADPSFIQHKPNLATVATSGEYGDILNRPDLSVYATTSEVADKADKVTGAVSGNLAGLDSNGNLTDSGVAAANLVHDASYVHTDNNFSDADVTKLSGIAAGAEVNVQSDWSQTDNSADDFIKNKPDLSIYAQSANLATVATTGSYTSLTDKPTIPDAQVQANWNETDSNSKAYIQNKPSIPAAQVQSDWEQTNSSSPDFIRNKPTIPAGVVVDQTYNASSTNAQAGVAVAEAIASVPAQVQADWNETNTSSKAYIQNKPTIPAAVTVDQTYSASSTNAQSGTAVAEAIATVPAQVQADWTETDTASKAYIAHKPSIPAAQVQSDWSQSDNSAVDYIKNKPTIPAAQVQANWNETDSSSKAYIQNKPSIPAAVTVDQTYSASSTNAQSGVAVAEAVAAISVDEVPAVTSSDDGKILKATYSGGTGSYDWESPPAEKNLVAGSNVSITSSGDNVTIAATDTTYTFSTGLTESSGTVTVTNPVPTPSSADENKVLGVTDSSGTLGWVAGGSGGGNEVPSVTSNDDGKILKASYSGGTGSYSWQAEAKKPVVAGTGISITNNTNDVTIAATTPVPAVTSSDDGKVLKATYSGGVGSYAWGSDDNTTYTAGNMIAIDSNNSNAIGVSTTAGITDIQQVNDLPANPVSTVLYLIPET